MQCFTLDLAPDGLGKLTAYIQTPSPELSNMNRRPAVLIFPGGAYQRCSDRCYGRGHGCVCSGSNAQQDCGR